MKKYTKEDGIEKLYLQTVLEYENKNFSEALIKINKLIAKNLNNEVDISHLNRMRNKILKSEKNMNLESEYCEKSK